MRGAGLGDLGEITIANQGARDTSWLLVGLLLQGPNDVNKQAMLLQSSNELKGLARKGNYIKPYKTHLLKAPLKT